MKKGKKLLLYGLAVLMAFQMPAISASAAQTGEIAQETVEAQTYEAVTATSGDFGVNNGLHWEYDTETKTVTVSGEDVPNVTIGYANRNPINEVFPSDTEKIQFKNCQITSNMSNFFAGLGKLKKVDFSGLTTSGLTKMYTMFYGCNSLTSLDMSGFDTGEVTDMSNMFNGCSSLTNLDVSGFDTSNVTNMYQMFYGCSSLTSLDMSGFDTGKVTTMGWMFDACSSLTTLVTPSKMGNATADLPDTFCTVEGINTSVLSKDFAEMTLYKASKDSIISGDFGVNNGLHWEFDTVTKTLTVSGEDVPNVTVMHDENWNPVNEVFPTETEKIQFDHCRITSSMRRFFAGLSQLKEIDFEGLTTSDLTDMSDMFYGCSNLKSLDLSGFDTSNVTDMGCMFYGCGSLTSLDVSGFDTSNVTNMYQMFYGCSSLTSLDLSEFDTGNVTFMACMFEGCSSLTNLNISGFDSGNVTYMGSMFSGCSSLVSLDVSGLDTSNVTGMSAMFSGCSSLVSLDVSGLDTSNVTGMSAMFSDCSSLTSLDLNGFDTGNVTDMGCMFYGCSSLTSLDLNGFDTGKVTDMGCMFYGCSSLTSLDLNGFDTGNVTGMSAMFSGCSSLTSLAVCGFDTSHVTDVGMLSMFSGCSSLTSLDLSGFDTGNVTYMRWMFSGCSKLASLDLSGFDTVNVTNMDDMFNSCTALTTLAAPSKMGDVTADLPATFYTADSTATTVLSKDFAGTTLYKEGHVPQPATPLAIINQPVSAEVKDGSQATFTVSATGDGLTYQWQLCYAGDDTFRTCTFPGADTATLTVDATRARNGYSFRCVITDEHGSSITTDAAKLTIKADVALGVALTASQTTADSGEIVTFTAVGNGGDGNYQYKFIINDTTNDKWYKLQDYSANNTIEWKATTAGTKRIMVDIKDGTGKSVGKNVSVVVNGAVAPTELKGTLTASSYEVNPGDVVTLTAQALGGSGKYNYKFIINDKTDDKWYRLQDYGTNSVIQWTATTPGTKRLMVDVMDSDGRKFGTNVTITVK